MKIFGVSFGKHYERMAEVLRRSVERNCPSAELELLTFPEPVELREHRWLPRFVPDNHFKLELWYRAVLHHDGDLVLIDVDTLVLRDLGPVFNEDFDVAFTHRDAPAPINAGVVYCRGNEKTRSFFARWLQLNQEICDLGSRAIDHIRDFAGANQRALHDLLKEDHGCRVAELPCAIWNSVQETWHEFSEKTAVLHVKGWLREYLLGITKYDQRIIDEASDVVAAARANGYAAL